jgi:hypothetical protein
MAVFIERIVALRENAGPNLDHKGFGGRDNLLAKGIHAKAIEA